MSVVKINVIEVPAGRGEVLEERFASRAGDVEQVDGFESFELLRPTEGTDRYLVVTRWRDDAAFQAWLTSDAFTRGHARSAGDQAGGHAPDGGGDHSQGGGAHPHAGGQGGQQPAHAPAATGSELWGFEIVTSAQRADA